MADTLTLRKFETLSPFEIKDELIIGSSLWLFVPASFSGFRLGKGRKRNSVAEVRFHELGELRL